MLASATRRGLSHPAAALLLLTLAALGCSVSPSDEVGPAAAELPLVTTTAQQTEPAPPQPEAQLSRIDPTTTGETGSDTAEATTTVSVQPRDNVDLTPTDTLTDGLVSLTGDCAGSDP